MEKWKIFLITGVILALVLMALPSIYKFIIFKSGTQEQKIADEWTETKPTVITEENTEKRATAAEWIAEIREYLLFDAEGQEIGYITHNELMNAKRTGSTPKASKKPKTQAGPAPTPVPVPVPTPATIPPTAAPAPTPAPTPTPTPTPITTPTPPAPPSTTPTPAPATPTPPSTPTPSAPVCGNGLVETGEQCEPPNTATCNANCQIIITPPQPAHCTNGQWDGDESDLDCGGSCLGCPPPGNPTYLSCWTNSDCQTRNCDMSTAKPLPALDINTGNIYTTITQLQPLAGQKWIIPWQGRCK